MLYRNWLDRLLMGVAAGALVLAVGNRAAIAEEEAGPNTGAVSFTLQSDLTNAYFFRGILNERNGTIWEPFWSLNFKLYDSEDGPLRNLSLGIGNWNSVQSKDTYHSTHGPKSLYESDFYPSLTATWGGGITTSFTYYFYTSPNGAFSTTDEADLLLAFDDSPYLGAFALKPNITFAFETKGTSYYDFTGATSRGNDRGNAAVLAIGPSHAFTIPGADSYPITVTVPVSVGLSMDDYYKDATHNSAFGYAAAGVNANIPLAFMPKRYGSWSITNGINVLFLSNALEAVNHGDAVYPVWTTSVIMSY